MSDTLLPLPEGKPCGGFPAKTQAKLCRNCAVFNKNYCVLCLGVVAARTNAVLCKECAVNKNNCILCDAYFDTLDVGAQPAALCRKHATQGGYHAKCAHIIKAKKTDGAAAVSTISVCVGLRMNILTKQNTASYFAGDAAAVKRVSLAKELRAPFFPVLRRILENPLEELVCTVSPKTFIQDVINRDGGALLLIDGRAGNYQKDGLTWRNGKMSVKQILYEETDGKYRLKNHKKDKGIPVMRRQTWISSDGAFGDGNLRRHEYRLIVRETFVKPENDGSLSRNEGSSLQAFPVLVHYFLKGGGGNIEKRSLSKRGGGSKRGRFNDDDDEDDDEEDVDVVLDDDEDYEEGQPSNNSDERDNNNFAAKKPRASSVASSVASDLHAPVVGDAAAAKSIFGLAGAGKAPMKTLGFLGLAGNSNNNNNNNNNNHNGAGHKRPKTELFDDLDFPVFTDDRNFLKDSLGGFSDVPLLLEQPSSTGSVLVAPETTCAIDACCPDYAHSPVQCLAFVSGFCGPERGEFDYSCTFSDVDVPATLIGDGVLKFTCPMQQPGVVFFWCSRRHRGTRLVEYTKHLPFFFLPKPGGDGRLSLAWRNLRTVPPEWCSRFESYTLDLDLSNNQLTSLAFVQPFRLLETLVVDSNLISACDFPHLPRLKSLSLNRNRLNDLDALLRGLAASFPNLQYLSLIGNDVCPLFALDKSVYENYRRKVAQHLPSLKILDSTKI